ncbi:aminotransferase class V-fold PLP-dependent enzyme [Paremcibacter congregatus]|uniref:Aminotransferase n=1 Tax=Paremcibacter congregatus TaxID=2043170 RepID=A0A2G4YNS8_9PROT|nr:aminotransferase class V-fold PLP-dependent enzyme [Paremcibacter congregatus]PHZ83970.1 aminotransferase [Paremcibacter congregatus]QDE25937.1 aminotransferase class V-fold PLP-dependent enzyme [Paremcibacter congregatus]
MTTFTCQKHLFDIPVDVTYLNAAYMGPIMTEAAEAGQAAVAVKRRPWVMGVDDFFDPHDRACSLMADMIGAARSDMAVVPAVSYGIALAAKNLPVAAGQKILVLAEQFPANVYAWQDVARKAQAELVTISRPADGDWTGALCDALDEKVAIVACAAAHWTDGGRVDLVRVGAACRAQGAALVLDLTQSLGVVPFSVQEVDPDFMVAAAYKWLLGPYSYGFVYVAPRHHGGVPLEEAWISRKGSRNFARLVDYQPAYEPGAGRFNVGERSNFMLTPIVISALERLNGWGAAAIATYLEGLTDDIAVGAQALGLGVADKAQRSPHLIGLNFKGGVPAGLAEHLTAQKIYVSFRGDSMRVSPHIYNDASDGVRLLEALGEFL